jgi:hypothetical protein
MPPIAKVRAPRERQPLELAKRLRGKGKSQRNTLGARKSRHRCGPRLDTYCW